jgi:4,5-DOPA dioxygenase extradiol
MSLLSVLYVPNSPTLIGDVGMGDRHIETERVLKECGASVRGRVRTVVVLTPHFVTRKSLGLVTQVPLRQVYDFQGFPDALFQVRYEPPGAPETGRRLEKLCADRSIPLREVPEWGLDHGAWSALLHLFPKADVPVLPLSICPDLGPAAHTGLGAAVRELAREEDLMVLATGSIIHNFRLLSGGHPEELARAREYLATVERSLTAGHWEGVWGAPTELHRAASPEGGDLPLRFLEGVVGDKFRAKVLAEESLLQALSMTTLAFTLLPE